MKTKRYAVIGAICLLPTSRVSSTTVPPPSFDELVSRAEAIFQGDVINRRSEWEQSPQGRSIVTIVSFAVGQVLKGQVGSSIELTFLGGTIGRVTLSVADMPQFRVGDRDVLFVSDERYGISPLVGFSHGRFRIIRDSATGTDRVWTHDGRPLVSVSVPEVPNGGRLLIPTPTRPMAYRDFESLIQQRLIALRGH